MTRLRNRGTRSSNSHCPVSDYLSVGVSGSALHHISRGRPFSDRRCMDPFASAWSSVPIFIKRRHVSLDNILDYYKARLRPLVLSTVSTVCILRPPFSVPRFLPIQVPVRRATGVVDGADKLKVVPVSTVRHRPEVLRLLSSSVSDAEHGLAVHFWDARRRMWPCTTPRGGVIMTDVQQDGDP